MENLSEGGIEVARLFQKIGSFAGDYSGAAVVLHELDGMIIFCDAGACMAGFLFGEEPKGGNEDRKIFSASLREKQVVMGIDRKLKKDALRTYEETGGKFIGLIGTPVAAVIGSDLNGIGREIAADIYKNGLSAHLLPALGVETNGWEHYDAGQEKAYKALIDTFVDEDAHTIGDVNVIGATSIDMWDYHQIDDCIKLLKEAGVKKPVVWGANGRLEGIAGAAGAKLNIAVSVSAIKAVKELHKRYGTPYIIGYPIGKMQTNKWLNSIKSILNGKSDSICIYEGSQGDKEGKKALVIGEQMTACSLRQVLEEEFQYGKVDVASFFKMDKLLKAEGDFEIREEAVLVELLKKREQYDLVIADPLCFQLFPYEPKNKVEFPHIAVSSLLYLTQSKNLFAEKGSMYLKSVLKETS